MSRWLWVPVALFGVALLVGSMSRVQGAGEGMSLGGGPLPKPPRADSKAERPAYLADFEGRRSMVLDAHGRVVRVFARELGANSQTCPGRSRRVAGAGAWFAALRVQRLDGTRLWRRRVPVSYIGNLQCLDERGRRVALVTESEMGPFTTLRIVSQRASRVVLRTRHVIPTLTHDRVYVTDRRGVHVYSLAGRLLHDLDAPAAPHQVIPSPDGRWLALRHLDENLKDRSFLADMATGEVRPIEIPRVTLLGWVANDRLAVRSDRHLRELDTTLQERRTVPGFAPATAVITGNGDVIAVDETALIRVRHDLDRVERIGTVPDGTSLSEAL